MNNIMNKALGHVARSPKTMLGGAGKVWSVLAKGCQYYWQVGSPFWLAREKRFEAWLLLAIVMVSMYAQTELNVLISDATNHYITALARKDPETIRNHLLMYWIGYTVAAAPVAAAYAYCQTRLALIWREWLANDFFSRYFSNLAYLKLRGNDKVKNPNQRMSQDIDSFANNVVWLLIPFIAAGVNIYMWSGVLWTLAGSTTYVWMGLQWNVSHLLTYGVIAYAMFGTVITILIGRPLVPLTNQQMNTEGDLRNILHEAEQEAQSIAFYRGEEIARLQAKSKLRAVIATLFAIMNTNRNINLFNSLFNGLVPLIAPWFIGALFVMGTVDKFGVIAQGSLAVVALIGALTTVMGQFGGIASFLAIVFRLGDLQNAIAEAGIDRLPPDKRIKITHSSDYVFDHLTVLAEDLKTVILKDINGVLKKGESLLILGKPGAGKTHLMMVLAGLNNAGSGGLQRPGMDKVMFLTQKPYLPASTLRMAIGYPCTDLCAHDEELRRVLHMVKLDGLEKRQVQLPDGSWKEVGFDTEQNWQEILSVSEQQRLSLSRIFFKSPEYPVVDDSIASLESDLELLTIAKLTGDGKTLIYTSTNQQLAAHFTWVMVLASDGTATMCRASEYKPNGEN